MHRLKEMKERLVAYTHKEVDEHLCEADAKELGEAIDMIKDLAEAIYYCTITEAMETPASDSHVYYYTDKVKPMEHEKVMSPQHHVEGKMWEEKEHDEMMGKSPEARKRYMEGKEKHHEKAHQMKELENYLQELTQDIVDMIQDASPEEKQILQQKIAVLSTKIK